MDPSKKEPMSYTLLQERNILQKTKLLTHITVKIRNMDYIQFTLQSLN